MKLYFMMGLPGERDEDIVAIANLADHVLELGRSVVPKARRGSISVSISVSVFIPKAATPFQWCPQLDYDDVKRRQKLLITSVRNRAVRVHYHDAETSLVEAALSRAGRDMTPVIIDAWRAGSRFDAGWSISRSITGSRLLPKTASISTSSCTCPTNWTGTCPGST